MKRALFHYPILNLGGAERSSLRMMKALADRGWQVTLVLTTGGGTLEPEIDPRINVVRLRPRGCGHRFASARGIAAKVMEVPDLICYAAMRTIGMVLMLPFLFRRYDVGVILAISLPTLFVRRFVRCKVRVHWIRTDLEGHFPKRKRSIRAIQESSDDFDHYICVSEVARQSLIRAVPEVTSKATVVYNILDSAAMHELATNAENPFPDVGVYTVKVLSVCRLKDHSKGLLRMVRICQRLADDGLDFVWFIVGDGPDRGVVEEAISAAGLRRRMILLGYMSNPFPAYRNADLVAMLSNYEGLCGVVNEAKVMGCAIIATEVSGVNEQLVNDVSGFVVPNDEEHIYQAMRSILSSREMLDKTRNHTYPTDILDDEQKLDKIEALFRTRRAQ